MKDFYRNILNIGNINRDLEPVIELVLKEYFSSISQDYERMCQVHAINIMALLKSKRIIAHKINSKSLGAIYEHYFLLIDTGGEDLFLIDPTYSQFDGKGKTLISKKLNEFPAKVLCQTEMGKEIYKDLITKGYSKVNIEGMLLYLNSLEAKNKLSIDDLIIAATKK